MAVRKGVRRSLPKVKVAESGPGAKVGPQGALQPFPYVRENRPPTGG